MKKKCKHSPAGKDILRNCSGLRINSVSLIHWGWKNQFLHSSNIQIWRKTKLLLRSLHLQPLRTLKAYPVPSNFCSVLSCFDLNLYWLPCMDSNFISCVCSPFQTSPKSAASQKLCSYLSCIHRPRCVLREAAASVWDLLSACLSKTPKCSILDVPQQLQNHYKNSANSFLSFSKARSGSQMHKALFWQVGMQSRRARREPWLLELNNTTLGKK